MSEENIQDGQGDESGAASSAVKNDVTPETHFKDEQGVPYYNRFREVSEKMEKFKDIDLDLYNRAKEYDFDEIEEALQFKNEIYSDQEKLSKVLSILKGEKREAAQKGQASPEVNQLIQRLEALENHLKSQGQAGWMEKFDSSVEGSLAESLKSDAFKDLGGNLTEFERKAVFKLVDDVYQADAAKRPSKLSLKDVPSVIQGVLKMVLDNRKGVLGGMVKKDSSPDAIKGDGSTGQRKPKPMSEEERIESMKNYMKDVETGRVPVS